MFESNGLASNCALLLVSFLWGATNPLIRRGSAGIEQITSTSTAGRFCAELKFLATRWQYLVPFVLNQTGSVLYVFILQTGQLSLVVPVVNSLSFVFTALAALCLGEKRASAKTYAGMLLIMLGTAICMWDKTNNAVHRHAIEGEDLLLIEK